MQLEHNLYSYNNKLIIKAQKKIAKNQFAYISKKIAPGKFIRLKDTRICTDIEKAFRTKQYHTILKPEKTNREIINIIRNILLPEEVIKELYFIKQRMPYTYRHILLTAIISTKIALDQNLPNKYDPEKMARLGIVHDLGKSRIAPYILNKTTPLTRSEHRILTSHPLIGYILLLYYCGKYHHLYDCAAFEHHERLDGAGYPQKLKKINKYSQVIAVVDIFDALISRRPYRKEPYTLRAALDFIIENAKKGKLNKKVAYLLICYARKNKHALKGMKISRIKRDAPPAQNVHGKITR